MTVSLSANDVLLLIDKYMYMTRDFDSKFVKTPSKSNMYECYYFFRICNKRLTIVKKKFNIQAKYFVVCVDDENFARAYYIMNENAKVKSTDIKVVEFTPTEAARVKAICAYKKGFNGHGEDPKCAS